MLTKEKLNNLQHIDDLIDYDGLSRVFRYQNEIYVSYCGGKRVDMFLRTTLENVQAVKNDQIDIRTFFEHCDEYYLVYYKENDQEIIETTLDYLINNHFIPQQGVFLNI